MTYNKGKLSVISLMQTEAKNPKQNHSKPNPESIKKMHHHQLGLLNAVLVQHLNTNQLTIIPHIL